MNLPSADSPPRFDPRTLASLAGLELKARYVMEGFLAGLHESPYHGFSVEFSDYRNYQKGDDLRRLDWRLYARSDRLCVKRFVEETNARFYLLVDTSASMSYRGGRAPHTKLDAARVVSAALAWLLLNQNDAVGLVAEEDGALAPRFVRPSQRPTQLGLLLGSLDALRASGGAPLPALLAHGARLAPKRSAFLVFSDLLAEPEAVRSRLSELRFHGHDVLVFQVLDGDEIDFPFTEARLFEDPETGARREVAPAAVRESYLARFAAFQKTWGELFVATEIPHLLLRTDESPWPVLARFLSERRRLR